jgi:hypothetical protein
MSASLTFFTTCKPFEREFAVIQRNALGSWTKAYPGCEFIVFGDEPGVSESCREFGLRQISQIQRSEYGTPLLNGLLEEVEHATNSDILAFINADIMLTQGLTPAIDAVRRCFEKFLLIARRWNVELQHSWNFDHFDWERELRRYARNRGVLEPPYGGVDLFVYTRGLWRNLPPFAVGRTRWDSALIYEARKLRVPIVDATDDVFSVHPNHDYSHVRPVVPGRAKGLEAEVNEKLLGGEEFIFTPLNATHRLSRSRIRPNRIFYPPYVLRRLATLPALYRPLRRFAPTIRYLAPYWRVLRKRLDV